MVRHHTIISGTGRAGTTFLMQLFTELGMDTGFQDAAADIYANCNAGMEWDFLSPKAPYVIKSPLLCDQLDSLLDSGEVVIDRAIIPMRDLFSVAESRRDVERRSSSDFVPGSVPGGLWHTQKPDDQESILQGQFYRIMHTLTVRDIPTTLLDFPRFINDPDYLFRKLSEVLDGVDWATFLDAFRRVAKPELVHSFRADSGSSGGPAR